MSRFDSSLAVHSFSIASPRSVKNATPMTPTLRALLGRNFAQGFMQRSP
jgi:hypothetical protein